MINQVNEIYDDWDKIMNLVGENESDVEFLYCMLWDKESMELFGDDSHVTMSINGMFSKQAVQQLCDGLNKMLQKM